MNDKVKNIVVTLTFSAFILLFALWGALKPDDEMSASERRKLALSPRLTAETVLSGSYMSDFATYSVDQFPARDAFRRLKSVTSFYVLGQKDNNGIYLKNGHASRLEYPEDASSVDYAVGRIENIYNLYLKDKDVTTYLCIIPDKNRYMADKYGYPSIDYDKFEDDIRDRLSGIATSIVIDDLLETDDYYSTDIHWRQERIGDVAKRLADSMGAPFNSAFEEVTVDVPFYGVYYGQSALPLKAEKIKYLTNPAIEGATVFDYESNSQIPVYNMELAHGRDPYEMYLNGSRSLIEITNENALSDKELIIFRDSFGSSLAPLLIESYKKITLVDIRYLQSSFVGRFVEFKDQDVLFMYSVPVLNNSVTMK